MEENLQQIVKEWRDYKKNKLYDIDSYIIRDDLAKRMSIVLHVNVKTALKVLENIDK